MYAGYMGDSLPCAEPGNEAGSMGTCETVGYAL